MTCKFGKVSRGPRKGRCRDRKKTPKKSKGGLSGHKRRGPKKRRK